jgi:hypothetical protein
VAAAEILPSFGTGLIELLIAQAFQPECLGRRAAAGDHTEGMGLAQDDAQIQQSYYIDR